jgi:homocysteine S-methyltransferase
MGAETGASPAYYMVNCAHPTHVDKTLLSGDGWQTRIRGLRANASTMIHEELDAIETLDAGDPVDLARVTDSCRGQLPQLTVLGGC